ncbi:amino acid adenylation domain-containing protein [Streptomyces sp. NPDC048172]|uniref:amino acid adenylation domain-containing protein n=1 Tax=Streptomyces sp. NPDC048172 TaxID=3365505 RepID=UPI00371D1EBA
MSTEPSVTVAHASAEQRRLLLLEQLADGPALYNVHFGFRWRGEVSDDALGAALETVVARHEALRTTFRTVDGEPRQVIAERCPTPVRRELRTDVAPEERQREALRLAAEHARRPFVPSRGPLFRVSLVSFSDSDHVFLLTLHHSVFDGWSAGLLFDELSEAYAAVAEGRAPYLEPLAMQYADFAAWQDDMLASGSWDRRLAHWEERLRDAPATLDLPTDRPRPAARSFRGGLVELALPPSVEAGIETVCRRYRCTRFGTLLAAFTVLLHRLTGADDLVVGTVDAGRARAELAPLIGAFSNTLALRVPVRGTEPFAALLGTVRERVAEAQSHADVPFAHVVRRLRPARAQSHNPLFQVMFDVQPGGSGRLRLPGVRSETLRVRDRDVSLFDLSLSVEPGDPGEWESRIVAEYATDLFDRATVADLLRAYVTLLGSLVESPDLPVGEAPLLTAEQRAGLLAGRDRTRGNGPAAASAVPQVTEVIAHRLRTGGEAPAVVGADGAVVTYRQLDAWTGAVAAALTGAGVRPGSVVALPLRRSAEAVAAVLGVLRAGASYLPLDPDQPQERNAAILRAARPAAVLTGDDGPVPGPDGASVVRLPAPPAGDAADDPDSPDARFRGVEWHRSDPDELAYTLFTSGSTGTPKGVMVTRGGLANYVAADLGTYGLTADDRVLMFTELTFDVSAEELFPALAAGAAVVPRTARMLDTPADFYAECERLGVTVTHLPTAWFHQLAAATETGCLPPAGLRAMAIGGEEPSPALVARWREAVAGMLLTNVYGPTEATIVSTVATLAGVSDLPPYDEGRTPLGDPIPGTSCYLLDARMEPVPPGAVGELWLGGAGLARGYLGDPARTAESFVPHPFATGERLYRTGDRARLGADGELEFRGRTDHQVKIRGHRVEPGEVEAALLRLPEIAAAAVVPRADRTGLVAHVVAAPGATVPEAPELRARLARAVPAPLVPSAYVTLPELPLTSHHKVDTAALPEPPAAPPVPRREAPRDGAEQVVAEVWREVLGLTEVGRHDDFFALGGHSLLATRVIGRLRRDFGGAARLTLLFERPVLADFADALAQARATAPTRPARPALVPGAGRGADAVSELTAGLSAEETAALLGVPDTESDRRTGRGQE